MNKIYARAELFAAFEVGQFIALRDEWMHRAREPSYGGARAFRVQTARRYNHWAVRALRRIPAPQLSFPL